MKKITQCKPNDIILNIRNNKQAKVLSVSNENVTILIDNEPKNIKMSTAKRWYKVIVDYVAPSEPSVENETTITRTTENDITIMSDTENYTNINVATLTNIFEICKSHECEFKVTKSYTGVILNNKQIIQIYQTKKGIKINVRQSLFTENELQHLETNFNGHINNTRSLNYLIEYPTIEVIDNLFTKLA